MPSTPPTPRVRAIVVGEGGRPSPRATLDALSAQTRPPDAVEERGRGEAVAAGPAEWVWLLEGSVAPAPDALAALLDPLADLGPLPVPVLLASKVTRSDGALDASRLPVPAGGGADLTADAFTRRMAPIRAIRPGSLLVRAELVARQGLPPAGDLRWSGRVLRDGLGLLVPASVAVRRPAGAREEAEGSPRARVGGWLDLLASDALLHVERPWFAMRFLEDALGLARRSA